jgi:ribonuclease HI
MSRACGRGRRQNFTLEEIRNLIESMGNKKAPGEDGITGEIYKTTFETFPSYTTALYNGCLRRGVFPTGWKRAELIPITKPGKENSEDVSKFRPISINIGGKVLEKVLINRINHHVFSHDLINKNQYGFTPQKSTIDAAMAMMDFVVEGLAAGEVIVLVNLDVKGAFDAAWWPSILKSLKACGCPKNLYNLTNSYFSQRTAVLSTNSVRMKREVGKGCPQGSCCGPGFWNIQYNSLLNLKFTSRTKAVAFADDLIPAIRAETVSEAENVSNLEISKITARSKSNKVGFNEEKSKVMLISRRKWKEVKDIKIYLNYKSLEQVTTMKYLGIIIDNKFKFSENISYAAEKCIELIHSSSKSAKVSWGLKHEKLKTIYKGAILPLLLYGTPVSIEAMKYGYNRQKYIRVQIHMNIRMAKAYPTTSSEALCSLTGLTPIIIKTEEAVKQYNSTKGKGSQTQLIDRQGELKNWLHPADVVKIIEVKEYKEQTIQVYTDGSKNEHGVGSGVAIFVGEELTAQLKFKLDNRCSNNQAEQLAIAKALEVIETIDIAENSPSTVAIFTDSRITKDSLKNVNNHSYLMEEIRKRISILERTNWTLEFSWVKAQVGIHGNELADQIAKAAARNRDIKISFKRIPKSTLYSDTEKDATLNGKKNGKTALKQP